MQNIHEFLRRIKYKFTAIRCRRGNKITAKPSIKYTTQFRLILTWNEAMEEDSGGQQHRRQNSLDTDNEARMRHEDEMCDDVMTAAQHRQLVVGEV